MNRVVSSALILLVVLTGACASGDTHVGHARGQAEGAVPGAPADAADADREIIVKASDELSFDPESIAVEEGEVVTFVVRNVGQTDHEFVLGNASYQDMHGSDMGEDMHMHMDNGVAVGPGETAELTWRFDEAGDVLYGCHEPGHYDGGMVGSINVS